MADITRTANAEWLGDLRSGKGTISTPSGVLQNDAYSFVTRFENSPGTNPEELVAAAHAACFSMAFSGLLGKKGYNPESLRTLATLSMDKMEAGFTITRMRLEVEGKVPNLQAAEFQQLAEEAEKGCPISRLLRPGLQDVEVVATLK
jgi:osmotically inducible protein OsmC